MRLDCTARSTTTIAGVVILGNAVARYLLASAPTARGLWDTAILIDAVAGLAACDRIPVHLQFLQY
ncbi:hypothetical protein C8Q80DRAFT_1132255 [Daedaleopsis nitida]|nr:hypothetical protein C8Q80DRAFT_1132255 [Daedaleopsis nitida]